METNFEKATALVLGAGSLLAGITMPISVAAGDVRPGSEGSALAIACLGLVVGTKLLRDFYRSCTKNKQQEFTNDMGR